MICCMSAYSPFQDSLVLVELPHRTRTEARLVLLVLAAQSPVTSPSHVTSLKLKTKQTKQIT